MTWYKPNVKGMSLLSLNRWLNLPIQYSETLEVINIKQKQQQIDYVNQALTMPTSEFMQKAQLAIQH